MNCPFCGAGLIKIAAICPSCKNQLPEAHLIPYYAAALARNKALAQSGKRAELDAIVQKEAITRSALLDEARERAKVEAEIARAEGLRRDDKIRARYATEAAATRVRREEFLERNRKKIITTSIAAIVSVSALAATINIIQSNQIRIAAPAAEVRLEPCVALGNSAKDSIALLERALDEFRTTGLSSGQITQLGETARDIQSLLFSSTIGQAIDMPQLEDSVLSFANKLGAFEKSLVGANSELKITSNATRPILQAVRSAESACQSSGFISQFNDASGWK